MASRRARPARPLFWRIGGKNDPKPPSLTASSTRVELGNKRAIQAVLNARQDWQRQAIDNLHAIGELSYGVGVPANLISRVTLFVATTADESDSDPVRVDGDSDDEQKAIASLDQLGSMVSRVDIQHDLAMNLLTTGEAYLIRIAPREGQTDENGDILVPPTPDRWEIRSILEVERSGDSVKLYDLLVDSFITLDPDMGDTFIRIWRPDPFNHQFATSHVRSILGPAEELLWWDSAAAAVAKQRLALAGLIGIPSNLELPEESEEDAGLSGAQRWVTDFLKKTINAIRNPTDASAAVPYVYTYPFNERGTSGIEVTEFERPQDELLEARTQRSLQRIEQGINLPVGVISGLGNTTHWGGGMVEQSVFRDHVEPLVLLVCSALTRSYLIPTLLQNGVADAEKYFIWYDASKLIVHQDQAANYFRAAELGGVNLTAVRRAIGARETDAPTDDELEKLAEWLATVRGRGPKEAQVEEQGQPNVEDPNAAPTENAPGKRTSEDDKGPATRGKGRDPVQASANGNGHAPSYDRSLVLGRLQVLCDEKCRRALEKANNRLVSRAKKNPAYKEVIRNVATQDVAATLGREAVTRLGDHDLFDDAFSDIHSRVLAVLPSNTLALDSIVPITTLATELRLLCSRALFEPAVGGMMVPIELIENALGLESLPTSAFSS